MEKRKKDAITAALLYPALSIPIMLIFSGGVNWSVVIGFTLGGFVVYYFLIPKMMKNRQRR